MKETKSGAKRMGRPPKAPEPGERVALGLRVSADTKKRLDAAAISNGRSQSQEAEFRIEESFHAEDQIARALESAYGPALAGILLIIARAMSDAGRHAAFQKTLTLEGANSWVREPYAYQQAVAAATAVLDSFRPEGDPEPPKQMSGVFNGVDLQQVATNLGSGFAAGLLAAVAGRDISSDFRRWAEPIRELLGDLADVSEAETAARTGGSN